MINAVFISDLHLHPEDQDIQERFEKFLAWAKHSVKNIYILGDFFHVWAGDDSINEWSNQIACQLNTLKRQGINLYYMHGNRDFLLGKYFAQRADWTILSEPSIIQLDEEKILLAHGDRYCTKDLAHQWFRLLTRNRFFSGLFLRLPLKYREKLVKQVRHRSQMSQNKSIEKMDVVAPSVIQHMVHYQVRQLIHGHTHKPGLTTYQNNNQELKRYVLSDWDDRPHLLCYDNTKGFYFTHF
ncbi:MAG: UDP-2,3-diacylglucosamine diphosphatase [Legionella longbeachae]|nr:UDP-2,3-diacylglucosamine diphosphatase [Legionella longbeachae]